MIQESPYWAREFVGAGPFKLDRWELGSFLEATAFEPQSPRISEIAHSRSFIPLPTLRLKIAVLVDLKRGEQTYDLLFADFEPPPDPVMRRTGELSFFEELTERPGLGKDIHILVLQRGGKNQVAPAAQNTAGLRAAKVLATAERD